jgi:hypothetical protein
VPASAESPYGLDNSRAPTPNFVSYLAGRPDALVQEEGGEMQWEFLAVLILGIPVILFPVVLVWFLNLGGVYDAIQRRRRRAAARRPFGNEAKRGGDRQATVRNANRGW